MECVNEVFEPGDAEWRGLGILPNSGLRLRPQYARFDAAQLLGDCVQEPLDNGICECGLILKGLKALWSAGLSEKNAPQNAPRSMHGLNRRSMFCRI